MHLIYTITTIQYTDGSENEKLKTYRGQIFR